MIVFRGLILLDDRQSQIRIDSIFLSMYNIDSKKDSFD
jgi:hypothetical protein